MYAPVLVTPPSTFPVTVAEIKAELPSSASSDDDLIGRLIDGVVSYLDGWTGILGRCLEEQTWRRDADGFCKVMRLPLGPAISIESVAYTDANGNSATVAASNYALQTDALGAYVRFIDDFDYPASLYETKAVSVIFTAGYAQSGGASNVPAAIQTAIRLMVKKSWHTAKQDLFKQSETVEGIGSERWSGMVDVSKAVDGAVEMLLGPYRVRRA